MILARCDEKGISFVELLIVLVFVGILTTAIARFLVVHNHLSIAEEPVSFMQKNIRTAMEIIRRDVMNAGSGVPTGHGLEILTPGDGQGGSSDSVVVTANFNHLHTTLFENEGLDNTVNVMDARGFHVGGLVCIQDFSGKEIHTITGISLGTPKGDQIEMTLPLKRTFYKIDTIVSPITQVSYALSEYNPDNPELMRTVKGLGTKVLANNIENLQFSYILSDGSETSSPSDITKVRMVRIIMTARTNKKDCDFSGDGYRRRTLESVVKLRNSDA